MTVAFTLFLVFLAGAVITAVLVAVVLILLSPALVLWARRYRRRYWVRRAHWLSDRAEQPRDRVQR